jgi:predicted dienelactone hydrolase
MRRVIVAILMTLTCSTAHAEEYNVGVRRIMTEFVGVEVPVRVFYPTRENATETRFGPWELSAARNAEPASGQFPLIAISHGLSGNDWNHHLLAGRLVKAGFVVAAVRHPDDLLRVGRLEITVLRPRELSAAIDAVLVDSRFGPMVDAERIGAFGFSLGGFTVLAAAGGRIEYEKIALHCANAENDPEFCIGEEGGMPLPMWLRARRLVYSIPQVDLTEDVLDSRIDAVVATAPVGVLFNDMSRVQMPVLLYRAGSDQSLRAPYHAENVHKLLPVEHRYRVIENLHHYAFLSPFPNSIAAEVGEPAQDPSGFDREMFLNDINGEIVDFFHENLVRK